MGPAESRAILERLSDLIDERRSLPSGSRSYVKTLDEGGLDRIGAKVIEEAAEVVTAAAEPGETGHAHLVHEVADLVFHTLVLMRHRGLAWPEVEAELARRFGVSGIDEKEARRR